MLSTNKWFSLALAFFCGIVFSTTAHAQTSVGVSLYGAFSGTTTGNDVQQSPSNAAGGLIELRHISNPIFGYEATYSYNRANQAYRCTTSSCPVITPAFVSANAHQVTVDWIPSLHISNLRPFGVLGVGLLLNQPAGSQANTSSSTRAVYVFGAGIDWGLLPHLGLRFQYRGSLYKSPDLSKLYTSTNAFTHSAQPMLGAYFSF
jgi:opacity protein-like surface antigen